MIKYKRILIKLSGEGFANKEKKSSNWLWISG